MERIDSVLWDEWVNSISPDKKENDAECSGIIEGIFVARKMDHVVLPQDCGFSGDFMLYGSIRDGPM